MSAPAPAFPRTIRSEPARSADAIGTLVEGAPAITHLSRMGMTHVAPNVRLAAYVWQPYVARITVR